MASGAGQQLALRLGLALSLLLLPAGAIEERLIGWEGETYSPKDAQERNRSSSKPWIETIAWSPRAFVYHNFLTPAECDHLVELGSRRVTRSLVVDSKTGGSKLDSIRTSFGGAFGRGEDPVIAAVEERIGEWTHIPPDYGEPIQILRYVDGQKYDAHWDWFSDPVHHKALLAEGNRYATVLLYLSEVDEGGETTLPLAEAIDEQAQVLDNPSICAQKMGIAIKPRKGDALLFFDMDIEGQKGDRKALHASCPTLKGTKWTATKWIHNKRYMGQFNALEAAARCKDVARDCASKKDQCDTDTSLTGIAGTCRLTCEDCVQCASGDIICQRGNMRSRRAAARQQSSGGGGGAPGTEVKQPQN